MQLFEGCWHQGMKATIVTYLALISACEKGHDLRKAMQLFEGSRHQGITPDIVTYSALISTCEKGKIMHVHLHLKIHTWQVQVQDQLHIFNGFYPREGVYVITYRAYS